MAADLNDWNEQIIAEFRANAGRVAWSTDDDLAASRPVPPLLPAFGAAEDVPIILVHHTGARTGRGRITPLVYQPVGDGFAVFATYGGSPRDPAWFRNLMANPLATVETGAERIAVRARLAEGPERARIRAGQAAVMPAFADFESAAGRAIPVVVLERVRPGPPSGG